MTATLTPTPDGALLEADDGVVAVPVYIALSRADLRALMQRSIELDREHGRQVDGAG